MNIKQLFTTLLLLCVVGGASAIEKSTTIVYINGIKYYIHAVQQGDTLYALSKSYEVSEEELLAHNPSLSAGLKSGFNIKIPVPVTQKETSGGLLKKAKQKKAFSTHYVVKGETLYSIARQYEIPIQTILEDNPKIDPSRLSLGQKLQIRKKAIGQGSEEDIREDLTEYAEQLSSVTEGDDFYVVQKGDTLFALSQRFGTTVEELISLNGGLQPEELKAGAMIRIPAEQSVAVAEVAPEAPIATQDSITMEQPEQLVLNFRAVCNCDPLKVSLLLPMTIKEKPNANYLEFYQGFLLGLDSLKTNKGYSIDLDLYDTKRDTEEIHAIVKDNRFRRSQLIVGPVYEEELEEVVAFAEEKQIPVVSPLAHITHIQSDALFLMAPDPTKKYAKAANMIDEGKQITLIYTESTDKEFEQEILNLLGERPYKRHQYKYLHPSVKVREGELHPSDLTPILDNENDNLYIIMANNEIDVDRILAALASADTNLRARSLASPKYTVLGNARWNRYQNIDRTIFFKNRVTFFSTYHAKRDSERIIAFDRAYLRAFGSLPSLYAYRGYDAAMIFVAGMYNDIEYDLEDRRYMPLQTIYRFSQEEEHKNHQNGDWMRVNYNSDFTITIE